MHFKWLERSLLFPLWLHSSRILRVLVVVAAKLHATHGQPVPSRSYVCSQDNSSNIPKPSCFWNYALNLPFYNCPSLILYYRERTVFLPMARCSVCYFPAYYIGSKLEKIKRENLMDRKNILNVFD